MYKRLSWNPLRKVNYRYDYLSLYLNLVKARKKKFCEGITEAPETKEMSNHLR